MVFISYSSKDTDAANAVRMVLQQNGIDCWMAPESIPMGGDYSNAIPSAVEECDLFLLILSKNSQESNWVPKELDLAITYNKQIIPFQIEKGNLTKPFNFRLTNVQRIEAFHNLETAYSQLVCQIKNIVNMQPISCENVDLVMPTASETLMNVDDQLTTKFDEIFGDEKKSDDRSPLQKKIQETQEKRFWNDMEKRMELVEELDDPNDSEFDYTQSLIPIPSEFRDFLLDTVGVTGKHFTLPNLNGYKTIAFEVLKCVDYKSMTYFFNCEPLDYYTDIEQENAGVSQTIYFVDEPKDAGCQLLFLHFNPIIGQTVVNMALMNNSSIKFSKHPYVINYEIKHFDNHLQINQSGYNVETLKQDEIERATHTGDDKEPIWLSAYIDEALPIIIDPETAIPVQREIYFDEECKEWKAKIKVIPKKAYFAFQIKSEESDLVRTPLSSIDIGRFYRDGKYGFPKNVTKAAEFFEIDGSADALYEISYLFRSESSLFDENLYFEYLEQAIGHGCERAKIEKSIQYIFKDESRNIDTAVSILKQIRTDSGVEWFLLGYLAETTNCNNDHEYVFNCYLKAAKENYKPALVRLGVEKINNEELIKNSFYQTLSSDNSIINYCIGCALFFGIGILPFKAYGLLLLEKSAIMNNHRAIEALYSIYEIDADYINKAKSFKYLQMIATYNLSIANRLANRLLDGIGCGISDDNDRQAFNLLEQASEADDMIARHNLAWLYKNGRGCNQDYALALQLFQEAQRPNSYFHIGDMYEHGLGLPVDMETAIDYYRKGAEKGSELAERRLSELGIATTDN